MRFELKTTPKKGKKKATRMSGGEFMVEQKRLELSTLTLPVWCSSQLSYCPGCMLHNISSFFWLCKRYFWKSWKFFCWWSFRPDRFSGVGEGLWCRFTPWKQPPQIVSQILVVTSITAFETTCRTDGEKNSIFFGFFYKKRLTFSFFLVH